MSTTTPDDLPRHLAIIMDGNGRWAKARGLPRMVGHRKGADAVRRIVTACRERNIAVLTLFAFSTQNWSRPSPEVSALMTLLAEYVELERKTILDNGISLTAIGDLDSLPKRSRAALEGLIKESSVNTDMTLCLALSYGGQEELVTAARTIAKRAAAGELNADELDANGFAEHLWSGQLGPVDLMIRTSGEMRISNFLLWSLAYAELYFSDLMWPEFDDIALDEALRSYASAAALRQDRLAMSNLGKRILSSVVLVPPLVALIAFGPVIAFAGFITAIAALAGFEFGTITLGHRFRGHRPLVATLAAAVCAAVFWSATEPAALLLVVLLLPITSALALMLGKSPLDQSATAAALTTVGALYTGALLGCMTLIFASGDPRGRYWIFLLVTATFVGDTMAYTVGRLLGKRKLAPRISPGKTWAGAVGGGLGTMSCIAVAKLTLLPELQWLDVVLFGVPLAAACQIGDLLESFFKRGFGVKDSGRIIPGHGGILDRIDGLMLGAPMVYLFSLLR